MKVSICVPIYGVEEHIEKCVRSLFEQTYNDLEFVFVNDCTKDHSIEVLKEVLRDYPHRNSQVRIIEHQQNSGLAVSRATAIQSAVGDFVFCVDSDDYLELDAIACLVNEQKITSADIVTGRFYINDSDIDHRFVEPVYTDKEEMLTNLLSNVWHHELCNRLIRRSLFVNHQIHAIPGVNVCEDWQVVPRLVYYAEKCVTLEKFTYHYIMRVTSIIHSGVSWEVEKKNYEQEDQSLQLLIDFFKETEYGNLIRRLWLMRQTENIDLSVRHRDREYFYELRSKVLAMLRHVSFDISRGKLFCIRAGYNVMAIFICLHDVKTKLYGRKA